MRLSTQKISIATSLAFSILWIICSIFVAIIPAPSMALTGAMIHADLSSTTWSLTLTSFIFGLFSWAILGGSTAGLISVIYNKMIK